MNIGRAVNKVRREEKVKNKNKNQNSDSNNRKYIINLIINNMEKGKTEEEALEIALKDKVAETFEYLEKNGLNKKECFRNWSRSFEKGKQNKYRDFEL